MCVEESFKNLILKYSGARGNLITGKQTTIKCRDVYTVNIYTLYSMLKQFSGSVMFVTDPGPRNPTELQILIRILLFASVALKM